MAAGITPPPGATTVHNGGPQHFHFHPFHLLPMNQPTGSGASRSTLSVAEAQRAILERVSPVGGWERVPVRAAPGRVLARDIIAPCNVPAHDSSAMDGYAVRAADLVAGAETVLTVTATVLAGKPFSGCVRAGEAVRIMTGAAMPCGADTVVIQEETRRDGERVVIAPGQRPGGNLRRAGEDLAAGAIALAAGVRCGPAELGLIASLGIAEVTVSRRLRVAFFSTGDEIASIGQLLAPGQVYDSNRYTLFAALSALGCELLDLGVTGDDPAALEAALDNAARSADVIITSGGVSMGEADFIRDMAARMGEVAFWKINIKPGRPMAFGRIGDALLFGLPGNPVAVLVAFYQFVQNALLRLMGVAALPAPQLFEAVCADTLRKRPGRREFMRGRLTARNGRMHVSLAGAQGSAMLSAMAAADCFIVLPEESGDVPAGATVLVQPFNGLI